MEKALNKFEQKVVNLQFQSLIQNAFEQGVDSTLNEIEEKLINLRLEAMFQKAYEQGVQDARNKFFESEIMTRTEAMEFLKCGQTKMAELMARPDFPVNREFGIKIPTRLLLIWIEQHTQWVENNTNYFNKKVI